MNRRPVPVSSLVRARWPLLLVGQLRRQVFTVEGKTSSYSSGTRLFTAEQKNALLVEARGQCSTPGCDNGNPSGSNEFGCAEHRPPVSKRAFRPPGPKGE